jgi:hypothetical protein
MFKATFVNIDNLLRSYKISFDADGVLINSGEAVVSAFNNLFSTNYAPKDVYEWDAIARWAEKEGLNEDSAMKINQKLWTDPEILYASPPILGAVEFTKKLYEQGSDFSIITSRIPELRKCTFDWFEKWMPWVKPEKINIRKNTKILRNMFKVDKINELGIKIHFEDEPKQTTTILEETPACVVFMSYTRKSLNVCNTRAIEVPTEDHRIPDMHTVYKHLSSKNLYVAQY